MGGGGGGLVGFEPLASPTTPGGAFFLFSCALHFLFFLSIPVANGKDSGCRDEQLASSSLKRRRSFSRMRGTRSSSPKFGHNL